MNEISFIHSKKNIIDKVVLSFLYLYVLIIPFSEVLARLLPIVLIFLWLFSSYYISPKQLLKEFPVIKYILLFIFYMAVTLLWSENFYIGIKELEDYLYWIVIVVFATVITKDNYKSFLVTFVIATSLSLFISYGLMYKIIEPINKFSVYWFLDSIDYSIYLSLGSIVILYFLIFKLNTLLKKIVVLILLLIFVNMLFDSNGRTGQYGFILATIYMFANHYNFSFKAKVSSILIAILFILFVFAFNNSAYNRLISVNSDIQKILNKNDFYSSTGVRYITAKIAFDASLDNVMFGHGIGCDYSDYIEKINSEYSQYKGFLLKSNNHIVSRPHCQYAFVSYRMGFIGVLLFGLVLYNLYNLKVYKSDYLVLYRAIFIIFVFSMLLNNILKSTLTTAMFLVFIGIALSLSRKSLKE